MNQIAGCDGCPAGWLLASRQVKGGVVTAALAETTRDLFAALADVAVLAIDIPIGLAEDGPRVCDVEARRLLGRRGSSVFPTPVRPVLRATSYRDACRRSARACGKMLSKQAYSILSRIREVDAELRFRPPAVTQVREVHPELCFATMSGGSPMAYPKRSLEGIEERLRWIERAFPGVFTAIRIRFRESQAANDDILDALAALWTAERIRAGTARTVPRDPPQDRHGLRMEMVA